MQKERPSKYVVHKLVATIAPRRIYFVNERACVCPSSNRVIIKSPSEPNLQTKCTRTPSKTKKKKKRGGTMQFSISKCQPIQSLSPFFFPTGQSSHRLRTIEKQGPYSKERCPITTMRLQSDRSPPAAFLR